ncbi:hypothetical protein RJ639_042535 [Escallonia herrerae]|uniref:Uncharacterized protein n=1 Tax=Escallonia herrerae TaxID=1293975 RepID=A0AA88WFH3_9ASTE|nr:hypothetical protein RJ639_042535 [Escallonia herrerae]
MVSKPFQKLDQSFKWSIEKEVPTATYFVRAYAYDSAGEEVAYGQNSDAKKSSNLFEVQGISGRHLSLDVASICFSAFALVSLIGFFLVENSKKRRYDVTKAFEQQLTFDGFAIYVLVSMFFNVRVLEEEILLASKGCKFRLMFPGNS